MGLSPKLLHFCLRNVKRSYIIIIPPDCPEHWREYNHHPSAKSFHVAKTKVPALWGKESTTIHAIRKWIIVDLLNIITVRWSTYIVPSPVIWVSRPNPIPVQHLYRIRISFTYGILCSNGQRTHACVGKFLQGSPRLPWSSGCHFGMYVLLKGKRVWNKNIQYSRWSFLSML